MSKKSQIIKQYKDIKLVQYSSALYAYRWDADWYMVHISNV